MVGASCNDPARVTDMVIGETVGPPVLTDPDCDQYNLLVEADAQNLPSAQFKESDTLYL